MSFSMTLDQIKEAIEEYGEKGFMEVMQRYGSQIVGFGTGDRGWVRYVAVNRDFTEQESYISQPRFILRPKRKVIRKRIILEQAADEPRPLRLGEAYNCRSDYWEGYEIRKHEDAVQKLAIPYRVTEETFEVEVEDNQ